MFDRQKKSLGMTLLELIVVMAMIAVVSGMMLTNSSTSITEQLISTARVISTDVDYSRSLATTYNSKYKITFTLGANKYTISHSGTNSSLDNLPPSPFRSATDPADQRIILLNNLPGIHNSVKLLVVNTSTNPSTATDQLEFGPYGETTETTDTVIWLQGGSGDQARYLSITINPITGLAKIGSVQAVLPSSVVVPGAG